jgi:hypothetical protein
MHTLLHITDEYVSTSSVTLFLHFDFVKSKQEPKFPSELSNDSMRRPIIFYILPVFTFLLFYIFLRIWQLTFTQTVYLSAYMI